MRSRRSGFRTGHRPRWGLACAAVAWVLVAPHAGAEALSAATRVRVESNQPFSRFGNSVASAGDVNGDGYDDVIVGAMYWDDGETNEGAAFIFLGGPNGFADATLASAATVLEGNQAEARFGNSVAGVGDVNGDGYDDVLVGAGGYDHGELNEGAAFLFLGGPDGIASRGAESADAIFEMNEPNAHVGSAVAGAGDVNGDGYDDILVGGRIYFDTVTEEGRVLLFLGGPNGIPSGDPTTAAASFVGGSPLAHLGIDMAGVGDVNGDGYDDILLGAEWYTNTKTQEGAAFLFLGGPTGIASGAASSADTKIFGDQENAQLGSHVAAAGDVNGDGYDDILVGATLYDAPLVDSGAAFLFLGGPTGIASGAASSAAAIFSGDQTNAQMGTSLGGTDVDGDGFSDVLVGAPLYDDGQKDEGAVFVYLGSASGIASAPAAGADLRLEVDKQGSYFGSALAAAGDVNQDGVADVIVGSGYWASSLAEDGEGAFWIYLGGPLAACQNQIDDDGDSAIDLADAGCSAPGDPYEEVDFGDGGMHVIASALNDGLVSHDGASATPTTVEVATGGDVTGNLYAIEHSIALVTGGSVEGSVVSKNLAHVTIRGGSVVALAAREAARLDLQGTGWNLPLGDVADASGTITGTLADGTPISATFERDAGATIHLAPEPGSVLLGTAGGLALGGLARRRRRCLQRDLALRYPRSS